MSALYGRVNASGNLISVGPLPYAIANWSAAEVVDLSHLDPSLGLQDVAFWPVVEVVNPVTALDEVLTEDLTDVIVDREARTVKATRVKRALTDEEVAARRSALKAEVMRLREEKMRAGFAFDGVMYDYDEGSQRRITGAAALAGFAMSIGGKSPIDVRWHDAEAADPFTWIAQDNSLVVMDAMTCFRLGQAAGAWEKDHVFRARVLKDAIDAGETVDIESGWPA